MTERSITATPVTTDVERKAKLKALLGDVRGGLVASTTCFAASVGAGAFIYSGALPSLLTVGLSAGLVTTALSAIVLSLTTSFRPVVGAASSITAAPLAAILVSMAPTLARLPPQAAAATIVAFVAVTTAVSGLALFLLGMAKLGNIVRFIPFPIAAGFMGVTGTLLALGAIRFGTGVRVAWAELPNFLNPNAAGLLGLTVGFALLITLVTRRSKHPLALPGLLLAAVVITDAVTYAFGHTIEAPPLVGLFLVPNDPIHFGLQFLLGVPRNAVWGLLTAQLGAIAAYVLLVVMATLLSSTMLETALNVDADYDREFRSQGVACLASSACGGFIGIPSVGATMAGVASGASGRVAGITNGLVMILAAAGAVPLLAYVPRFVIGGLLAHIGFWTVFTWCVKTRSKMPRGEWLVIVGIVAITVWAGLVAAVLAGLIAGCVLFAIDVSRISVVKREYGVDQRASAVVRPSEELAILSSDGHRIRFIELGGMLFFGSAYQIVARVRHLLASNTPDAIVFDLTAVTGCDSSATAVIARMRKMLKREAIRFAVAGASEPVLEQLLLSDCLNTDDATYSATNQALEAAETALLQPRRARDAAPLSIQQWLSQALGGEHLASSLIEQCHCEDHAPGDYLCREGEPTDTLLFIETGRVGVMIGPPGVERCVRIFGPHTIAGEYGFVLGLPRTASLKVELPTRVWLLGRDRFGAIQRDQPDVAFALLRDIVRQQSERLAFSTRQSAMLA